MQPWMVGTTAGGANTGVGDGGSALVLGGQALQAQQAERWQRRQQELRSVWDTLQPLQRSNATRRLSVLASHVAPDQLANGSPADSVDNFIGGFAQADLSAAPTPHAGGPSNLLVSTRRPSVISLIACAAACVFQVALVLTRPVWGRCAGAGAWHARVLGVDAHPLQRRPAPRRRHRRGGSRAEHAPAAVAVPHAPARLAPPGACDPAPPTRPLKIRHAKLTSPALLTLRVTLHGRAVLQTETALLPSTPSQEAMSRRLKIMAQHVPEIGMGSDPSTMMTKAGLL